MMTSTLASVCRHLATTGVFALAASALHAQTGLPIEKPILKTGDTWTYRTIDLWTQQETGQFRSVFAAQEDNFLIFRVQRQADAQPTTARANLEQQGCRSMNGSSELVCAGPLRFPLTEGYRHTYKKFPWINGMGYADAECEGKGLEPMTTPVGTFDTYKVSCKGFLTRVFEGSSQTRFEETHWFAPAVKRIIRSEYNTWNRSGQLDTRNLTELVAFQAAP